MCFQSTFYVQEALGELWTFQSEVDWWTLGQYRYPKFEEDVLENWLAVVTHKKMLKLRHGLLVVLQDLQEINWKFYS